MVDYFELARGILQSHGLKAVMAHFGVDFGHQKKIYCINPHHEDKKPSASIKDDAFYKCWSCGFSGDGITLISKLQGITEAEAAKTIYGLFHTIDDEKPKIKARRLTKTKRTVQGPAHYPVKLSKDDDALKVLEFFWDMVKDEPLNEDCISYLKARNLDTNRLYAIGVRSSNQDHQERLKQKFSSAALNAAGFSRDNSGYFFGQWKDSIDGLLIPGWYDPDLAFPLYWKYRRVEPDLKQSKSLTMVDRSLSGHLLGVHSLFTGCTSPQKLFAPSFAKVAVLVEGEPDYLTAIGEWVPDTFQVAVIGLVNKTAKLQPWFITLLSRLAILIDFTHEPKTGESVGQRIKTAINDLKIPSDHKPVIRRVHISEEFDLNDFQRGLLGDDGQRTPVIIEGKHVNAAEVLTTHLVDSLKIVVGQNRHIFDKLTPWQQGLISN